MPDRPPTRLSLSCPHHRSIGRHARHSLLLRAFFSGEIRHMAGESLRHQPSTGSVRPSRVATVGRVSHPDRTAEEWDAPRASRTLRARCSRTTRLFAAIPGCRCTPSVVRRAPETLDVGASLLRVQPPFPRASGRRRRPPRRRRRPERLDHHRDKPFAGGITVAQLCAMLGCRDRQDAVDEASTQAFENALSLEWRQRGRAGDIPDQLCSRVRGVDALSARTR